MDLVDNNILISAFRPDVQHHLVAQEWLHEALNNGRAIRLFPTVEVGFLRVVTHSGVFKPSSTIAEASNFLNILCGAPTVGIASWTLACRRRWLELCGTLKLSGNDCNDATLAAVAIEKGLRLVTFDRGFQRFSKLKLELLG